MSTTMTILKLPYTVLKAVYTYSGAQWVAKAIYSYMSSPAKTEVDKILAPFLTAHAKLVAVQAALKAAEDAYRAQAAVVIAQADAQAAAGAKAAAAAAKLGDLVGKDATPPATP